MKLSELRSNTHARENGRWMTDLPNMGDLKIFTRGLRNAAAAKLTARFFESLPRKEKRGTLSIESRERLNTEILVETCVMPDPDTGKAWNLTDDAGADIPFSKEKLRELLTDPDYIDFRDACLVAATTVADNEDEEDKADLKN
ncbi:hypothetical protein [Hyphomonas sp.]|uniref:hypothetical protein n=1 Tax=Hyphomonas sp. TaxID=87 RepID=UPI0025BFFA76|nr:hypothetical protein [Hyphomonas sp.]